jgi:hypothetical protein
MSRFTRWMGIVACSGALALAASSACSTEKSPETECKEFLELTEDCYAKAGRQVGTNPMACEQDGALTPQLQAQIKCSLQYSDTYCSTITRSASGDAAAFDPRDPSLVKYNACISSSIVASPCKEAILAMAECGTQFGFQVECTGQSAALARCVLDNREGACSLYKPREGGTMTPAEQTFQKCQSDASRAALDASGG